MHPLIQDTDQNLRNEWLNSLGTSYLGDIQLTFGQWYDKEDCDLLDIDADMENISNYQEILWMEDFKLKEKIKGITA